MENSLSTEEKGLLSALGIVNNERLTKVCTKCEQEKSITHFELHPSYADGRRSICRDCRIVEHKEYYQRNKDLINVRSAIQRAEKPREYWAYSTMCGHRRRGCTVFIERKQLIELAYKTDKCMICGIDLDWDSIGKGGVPQKNSPSLDRVNCDKILVLNNIQIVCNLCNLTKNSRTMDEFISYCKLVTDRYTNKENKDEI